MLKKRNIFLFFTTLLFLSCNNDTISPVVDNSENENTVAYCLLSGRVLDTDSNKGIAKANIKIGTIETQSDYSGNYQIKIAQDQYNIIITHPDYDKNNISILLESDSRNFDIGLTWAKPKILYGKITKKSEQYSYYLYYKISAEIEAIDAKGLEGMQVKITHFYPVAPQNNFPDDSLAYKQYFNLTYDETIGKFIGSKSWRSHYYNLQSPVPDKCYISNSATAIVIDSDGNKVEQSFTME